MCSPLEGNYGMREPRLLIETVPLVVHILGHSLSQDMGMKM